MSCEEGSSSAWTRSYGWEKKDYGSAIEFIKQITSDYTRKSYGNKSTSVSALNLWKGINVLKQNALEEDQLALTVCFVISLGVLFCFGLSIILAIVIIAVFCDQRRARQDISDMIMCFMVSALIGLILQGVVTYGLNKNEIVVSSAYGALNFSLTYYISIFVTLVNLVLFNRMYKANEPNYLQEEMEGEKVCKICNNAFHDGIYCPRCGAKF